MPDPKVLDFGPFRIDFLDKQLLRDGAVVPLTPKAFDLLTVLARRRGRLVTKEEVFAEVWGGTFVEDSNLTFHVSMLRKALGDRDGARCIETVPRRGYRFVASTTAGPAKPVVRRTVGRQHELGELRRAFDAVRQRPGHLVCICGEPGIGKTTLVEDFLEELSALNPGTRVGRGRCSERLHGTGAYLPVLDAIESLCSGADDDLVRSALESQAPSWYAQVALHGTATAPSQERLKRELAAFFADLTRQSPTVLFLDDLQWADTSTVDLLAYLATRFDELRLLVLGAYRPAELALARHPFAALKLDLQGRGRCRELALTFLTRDNVSQYLAVEFRGHQFPDAFAQLVYEKTEGNALFMVDLLRYLRDRGTLQASGERWTLAELVPAVERNLPESIRSVIQRTIERLDPVDRRLLTAASVQGAEFLSTVIAEAAGMNAADAEERLDVMERVHGLVERLRDEELPDTTCGVRYRFVHVLYHDALYEAVMPGRKAVLSSAIAASLERHYATREGQIASELGLLLGSAREFPRAAAAFLRAAQHALGMFASHEAAALARRGLSMLSPVPAGPERDALELPLQALLGLSAMSVHGFAAPEVERAYARALALCQSLGDRVQLFPVLSGLWFYYTIRAELDTAHDLAAQLLRLAEADGSETLAMHAHLAVATTAMDRGELETAFTHGTRAAAGVTGAGSASAEFPMNAAVMVPAILGRISWTLGDADTARVHVETAVARARASGHPQPLGFALTFAAIVSHFRSDVEQTLAYAQESAALSREHGLVQTLAWARLWRGWAMAQQGRRTEGIHEMREALADYRAIGSEISRPHFLALLAEALGDDGRADEGLVLLAEAHAGVETTGERFIEAEIHRLRGRLLLQQSPSALPEAERAIRRAVEIASQQGARGWEERARTELEAVLPSSVTSPRSSSRRRR